MKFAQVVCWRRSAPERYRTGAGCCPPGTSFHVAASRVRPVRDFRTPPDCLKKKGDVLALTAIAQLAEPNIRSSETHVATDAGGRVIVSPKSLAFFSSHLICWF